MESSSLNDDAGEKAEKRYIIEPDETEIVNEFLIVQQ